MQHLLKTPWIKNMQLERDSENTNPGLVSENDVDCVPCVRMGGRN